jgi:esterase/lipase superfamily enzyme
MTALRMFRGSGHSMHRHPVRHCLRWLALTLPLSGPTAVLAQSVDLVSAYQEFEHAKATNQVQAALNDGNRALKLLEAEGGDVQSRITLLRNLGDFSAQAGEDQLAEQYYQRQLALQESTLGADHPDLVPVLSSLADLRIKSKRYTDAEAIEERILHIERQAYGDHHENVHATLSKLRDIYRATGDAATVARIDQELQASATAERGLHVPSNIAGATGQGKQNQDFATVRVFYGTNRAPSGELKPALYYGKARGPLQFGYLDVTIPKIHKEAELETQPRWAEFVLDAGEARSRYVLLDKVTPLAQGDFLRALQQQIKSSRSRDVFIFVHGFNNTFEDAARRAAQLAYDLDFDGTPMLYSWPSQASTTAYAADEAAVGVGGLKMADFLDLVVAHSGAERIHLLAHSMGNRALLEALQTYLARRTPQDRQHIFGQIVFTAPDVDREYFMDAIEPLRSSADRVTLYASDNDYALRSSEFIHDAPRAGSAGRSIIALAGLDTIDMSALRADGDPLGHSYFAANGGAIFDVFRLLWRGDPPPRRCGMRDHKIGGALTIWVFHPNGCEGEDLLEAAVLLKRFGNGDLARRSILANIAGLTDRSQKDQWARILNRLDGLLVAVDAPAGVAAK